MAPYEADAQLAYLTQRGLADIVITEDSDLILFGCEKVRKPWESRQRFRNIFSLKGKGFNRRTPSGRAEDYTQEDDTNIVFVSDAAQG